MSLNVLEARRAGAERLQAEGIESAQLDTDILLAHALCCSREKLFTRFGEPLQTDSYASYLRLIERRAKFEPIAYLIGKKEFYGRDFKVNPAVLIPRPETEQLIELGLATVVNEPEEHWTLVDVGTGSGAIILSLVKEIELKLPALKFTAYGLDLSESALEVANLNRSAFGLTNRVDLLRSDLLSALPDVSGGRTLILANLPYIPIGEVLPPDVENFEPRSALRSDREGLDHVFRLLEQISALKPVFIGALFLEIGKGHSQKLSRSYPGEYRFHQDLAGVDRMAEMRLR